MSMELYKLENRGAPLKNQCTISTTQIIFIGHTLVPEEMKWANLHFDKDARLIGIELLKEKEIYAKKLLLRPTSRAWSVCARGLMSFYKIAAIHGRYDAKVENGMIVFGPVEMVEDSS